MVDMSDDVHLDLLRLALIEANRCEPTPTAFCVGCWQALILSSGYSRELRGNTHAEANALAKLRALTPAEFSKQLASFDTTSEMTVDELLRQADVYTTMEPCSVRTSGLAPCADALITAGIRRCFIGVGEPDDFVQCEGARKLKDAGIEVIWLRGMEDECLAAARRGHDVK
ncbi:diaminohydroxyphosphoribosylamino-pyrimidine deaminase [Schizophyllum amplum]|uniref:Diaminohydroxyphosphoribosylamino-pyrimidine deaminase n=1 Tax=Schizophyllum amplum TaxID=97359 RepID=A0A550CD80_9AGAR|nr:diaminohydroxyphosphoribosylamino-pyrimidine deaminase [Auriculariopsis ampla]